MATLAELTTELAAINAAISRVIGTSTTGGAQSISVGGNQVSRASLTALYKRKAEVEAGIARKSASATTAGASNNVIIGNRS